MEKPSRKDISGLKSLIPAYMFKHQLIGFTFKKDISKDKFMDLLNDVVAKEGEIDVRNYCSCNGNIACVTVKSSRRKAKVTKLLANYFPGFKRIRKHTNCECLK